MAYFLGKVSTVVSAFICVALVYSSIVFAVNDGYDVQQIHIAQGKTPESMTISWVTKSNAASQVKIGLNQDALTTVFSGSTSNYSFDYPQYGVYESGFIHHVSVTDLAADTTYFYQAGDFGLGATSGVQTFQTLTAVGKHQPMHFAVIGDLGTTTDSQSTMNHVLANNQLGLILHAGDLSYADCQQTVWDTYGVMIEDLAKARPWMVGPGNHEVEYNNDGSMFLSFEERYRMPGDKPAEFGAITIPPGVDSNGNPYCASSVFQAEYNYGNSFFSFEAGMAHVIYINPYSVTNSTSVQYKWLESDLASIDRTKTPWLIVVMHCPWYNSNLAHTSEQQAVLMRDSMEPLLYKHQVNMVIAGHVHAYERSWPVYKNETVSDGIVYIVIGDGGNREGHASTYSDPQPSWSAYRNGTQYGHGEISLWDQNKMTWRWMRNVDGEVISKDEIVLCNSALGHNVDCARTMKKE
jgi:hypothetical protein